MDYLKAPVGLTSSAARELQDKITLRTTVQDIMDSARRLRHVPPGKGYDEAWRALQDKVYAALVNRNADIEVTAAMMATTAQDSLRSILGIETQYVERIVVAGIPSPEDPAVRAVFDKYAAARMGTTTTGVRRGTGYRSSYATFAWDLLTLVLQDLIKQAEEAAKAKDKE